MSILSVVCAISQAIWEGIAISDRTCEDENATYDCESDQVRTGCGCLCNITGTNLLSHYPPPPPTIKPN